MAEDSGQERTEEASDHKLQELRRKGNIAQSKDFTTGFVLLAGYATLSFVALDLGVRIVEMTTELFQLAVGGSLDNEQLYRAFEETLRTSLLGFLPFLVITAVVGGAVQWLQVGPVLALEKLEMKLENLDPIKGLKNKFFSARTWIEFAKSLTKIAIVAIVLWQIVKGYLPELVRLGRLAPLDSAARAADILDEMVKWTLVCFLGVGAFDFFYQRFQFLKENRMTKEEVKKEYKQMEGDPETKARIKRSRMERMQSGMYRNLQTGGADVVTVNPTHIACALRFDPTKEGAPRLIAKGKGVVAQRIREIAEKQSIPIREDVPLARALVKVELNRVIPEALHEAVAELLNWVAERAHDRGETAPWEERVQKYLETQEKTEG